MSNNLLTSVRQELTKLVESDLSQYDQRDIELIGQDWYLSLFTSDKKSVDSIVDKVDKCLKWRKSTGVNDLSLTSFPAIIYRQSMFEFYQVGNTWYTVCNYRNVLIPSTMYDVYYKYVVALSDFLQYKRAKNITLVTIHDCSGMSMANFSLPYFSKVSNSISDEICDHSNRYYSS